MFGHLRSHVALAVAMPIVMLGAVCAGPVGRLTDSDQQGDVRALAMCAIISMHSTTRLQIGSQGQHNL